MNTRFQFLTTLEREPAAIDVIVRASVQAYADAIGCADEQRGRFAGELSVEVLSVTDAATGQEMETTTAENAALKNEAAQRHP